MEIRRAIEPYDNMGYIKTCGSVLFLPITVCTGRLSTIRHTMSSAAGNNHPTDQETQAVQKSRSDKPPLTNLERLAALERARVDSWHVSEKMRQGRPRWWD